MKIVFIINNLANGGGVERTLTDKANYLSTHGHEVFFVTYEQGQHREVFPLSDSVKRFDLDCRRFTMYRYPYIVRTFKMLQLNSDFKKRWKSFVLNHKPDVVIVTTYSDDFMSQILSVKKYTHIVVESHSAFTHDMKPTYLIKRFRIWRTMKALKKCDLLIALTNGDAMCWKEHIKNVRKVINPLTHYEEQLNDVVKIPNRIICVGRLHEQKRYDRLIDSFAKIAQKYPEWCVDIFGLGPLRSSLVEMIADANLQSRVMLREPTSHIYEEYAKSQFLVLSSDYEGLPLVVLEAMACGVPVVSTDCPFGPAEVIEDGKTGLLAEMNVEDLSEKMEWMITHEKEREEMGKRAHIAVGKFKINVVMRQWEEAYRSVTAR